MMAAYILVLVFSLSWISQASQANNPGISFQLTDKEMNDGVGYLFDKMTKKASALTLPDISSSYGVDCIKYQLQQIKIASFEYERIASEFVPQKGIKITVQEGNGEVNCNWNLQSWFVNDHGTAVLMIKGVSISLILGLDMINPGVPSISVLECQSEVKAVDMKIQSKISYVYDVLNLPISEVVRRSVSQQLCKALKDQIKQWNKLLNAFHLKFTLAPKIEADWSLLRKPDFSADHADFSFKGQFNVKDEKTDGLSLDIAVLRVLPSDGFSPDKMVFQAPSKARPHTGVSEASFNSLLNAYHKSGSLNHMLTKVLESEEITRDELATVIPPMHLPDKSESLKIGLHVTSSPTVDLNIDKIKFELGGRLFVKSARDKNKVIFCSKILASLNGDVSMSDSDESPGFNMTASFSLNSLQIDKNEPRNKAPKDVSLEKASQQIFNKWVLPPLNDELEKGAIIPTPMQFIKNTSFISQKGYALMEAEVNWDILSL